MMVSARWCCSVCNESSRTFAAPGHARNRTLSPVLSSNGGSLHSTCTKLRIHLSDELLIVMTEGRDLRRRITSSKSVEEIREVVVTSREEFLNYKMAYVGE